MQSDRLRRSKGDGHRRDQELSSTTVSLPSRLTSRSTSYRGLVIVVQAVSKHAFGQRIIFVLAARISAFVIAVALEHALPVVPVELYLRYPGNIDVAIDAELVETAQRIGDRCEYLRQRGRTSIRQEPQTIPAQVLAYVLTTTNKDAREACTRADLRIRRKSERSGCHHTRNARVRSGHEHAD